MNLHIVPDNVFINKFYDNLEELGLTNNNKIVARTQGALKFIKRPVLSAKLYSKDFDNLVGDTHAYDNVFIHQFSPLLYRWVAKNHFRKLHWMSWGADIYNLPALDHGCYEPETYARYVKGGVSLHDWLYRLKVKFTQSPFESKAYSKVSNLLTWMDSEFKFAKDNLPSLNAAHQFFFYENQMPYQQLDNVVGTIAEQKRSPLLIVGNSASHALNHLDAVRSLQTQQVKADLLIPISYGDKKYASFLKGNLSFYTGGEITYQENYLDFDGYLKLLSTSDGLVMNNIRPQGYGNIFMMMYLGKKVYLNPKNISIPDLNANNLKWISIDDVATTLNQSAISNKQSVRELLSHERVLEIYPKYFA
ncbi:TDP-N-acetylfucosamine:lipid II N-acetylfucosaminyltransferase [Pseudochryseolinea flava]|uniref:4-alpha-L-fucosyltransferase n=1 Tax=Pseudochryseolinea flava TaxID=2059302 RepID=A0A364Y4E6_9BACT|nr:TDP-N-acetylfucosamine:lipid II N-acetylfucosaminyltransferase [Pseudochryseolinea flava]RAW01619.1 hypothetical protein DQQ10_08155 [Pseudochryseolinea flava]